MTDINKEIKIIIVEDHEIFRTGLVRTITKNLKEAKVVGEASNGAELLDLLKTNLEVDLVLMDIQMPVMDGIEATKLALTHNPNLKIAALSTFFDDETIQLMFDAGSKGFLVKNISAEEISKAIRLLSENKNYFSDEVWSFFSNKLISKKVSASFAIKFTRRQLDIIQLICQGFDNEEIAKKLYISDRTVIGHKSKLLEKTGCRSTSSLISFCVKNRIVDIKPSY